MRERVTVFIFKNAEGTSAVAEVLLIHRFKDGKEYYVVPGGGIEPGETEVQAALREVKEETSLQVILSEKIGELETDDSHENFYFAKLWTGTLALSGPEAQRQSPTNSYGLEWIPIEQLGKIGLKEDTRRILLRHLSLAARFLDSMITITIDRPLGSTHPQWGFEYPVNYGYVPDTKSGDGEEMDAYVLGITEPRKEFAGRCIAIIHRLDDDDDKLALVPDGMNFTDDEIRAATDFQEKFFKSVIVR